MTCTITHLTLLQNHRLSPVTPTPISSQLPTIPGSPFTPINTPNRHPFFFRDHSSELPELLRYRLQTSRSYLHCKLINSNHLFNYHN
ncbi:hypothetical protein QVD17_21601 [Tagetes erecta]|uniref:Uncharacterized protein n=1 Tax=Tagetes erecta TaxID=13708 RepID=A0AAD8KF72_TARER|nr:hypothetical protein QVD17_21601 [Tagetes erecta]